MSNNGIDELQLCASSACCHRVRPDVIYDLVRCPTCGYAWTEHDAGCSQHKYKYLYLYLVDNSHKKEIARIIEVNK